MILRQFFVSLSYLFHPVFMPLLGIYLLFNLQTTPVSYNVLDALFNFPDLAKYYLYIIVGILTILAPLLSLLIMYWNKIITNFNLENRAERAYPLLLVSFYYLLAYFYVRYLFPEELRHPALIGFLFGCLLIFVVALIVNVYVKMSLHAAGIFGLCGMLLGYSQTQLPGFQGQLITNLYIIVYLACVAGLVAAARLYLKAHSLNEIIFGSFIGFSVMYVSVKYGLFI